MPERGWPFRAAGRGSGVAGRSGSGRCRGGSDGGHRVDLREPAVPRLQGHDDDRHDEDADDEGDDEEEDLEDVTHDRQHPDAAVRGAQAQYRPCALDAAPLETVSTWAEQYRPLWEARFDRMDEYLRQLQTPTKGRQA